MNRNFLHITIRQDGEEVYSKDELTDRKVEERSLYIWVSANFAILAIRTLQGNKGDLKKRFAIEVTIQEIMGKKGRNTKTKYYSIKGTKDETKRNLCVFNEMFIVDPAPPVSTLGFSNTDYILNAANYQLHPLPQNKGPERPHPFRD